MPKELKPIEEREPVIEEPKEPEPTPEELLERDISRQDDAEQLRIYDLARPGMPMKAIIARSEKLGKQVCRYPHYDVVEDEGKPVGYARAGEAVQIQEFGVIPKVGTLVGGTRGRGEVI